MKYRDNIVKRWSFLGASWLVNLLIVLQAACAQPEQTSPSPAQAMTSGYAFNRPAAAFQLPKKLEEISGLTVLDERHLAAVQDEDGVVFILDMVSGDVVAEHPFGKKGDYEAIERVEDRLYVLRSDGRLYEIKEWQGEKPDVTEHKTDLRAKNDTEGLVYDAARRRLLIACKEDPGKGLKGQKAIYAFDLERQALDAQPAYVINSRAFSEQAEEEHALNRRIRALLAPAVDLSGFKPSALAIHPITGQVYVLSSVRKAIAVLDVSSGRLDDVRMLPDALFLQPEGMAFLPNGDLFIANEGSGGKATLLRFAYQERP